MAMVLDQKDAILEDRSFIYSFLAKIFFEPLSKEALYELKRCGELLQILGGKELLDFMFSESDEILYELLNIDFTSIIMLGNPPIATSVLHSKKEILTGAQNPVMFFYHTRGYSFLADSVDMKIPDHVSTQFMFMVELIRNNETDVQKEFLRLHILNWMPAYLVALKGRFESRFYRAISEFTIRFLQKECSL